GGERAVSIGLGAIVRDATGGIAAQLGARISWAQWEGCDQNRFRYAVINTARGLSFALGYHPRLEQEKSALADYVIAT
ncbi:MAG TPA: hypothetical protein VHV83_11325, partial [Armatimonadota bacterium]|nr:hypothetical protein [Armatimonadota bacterium]